MHFPHINLIFLNIPDLCLKTGHVSLTLLRVKNAGTLALKYHMIDYITFKFIKLSDAAAVTKETANKTSLTANDIDRHKAKALV